MPVVRAASLAPRADAVEAARKGAREAGRSEAESLDGVEHGAIEAFDGRSRLTPTKRLGVPHFLSIRASRPKRDQMQFHCYRG